MIAQINSKQEASNMNPLAIALLAMIVLPLIAIYFRLK